MAGLDFLAWSPAEARYGAEVHSEADLDGDGRDDLVVGAGPDPLVNSTIKIYRYDGSETSLWINLQAYPDEWSHGVKVTAGTL